MTFEKRWPVAFSPYVIKSGGAGHKQARFSLSCRKSAVLQATLAASRSTGVVECLCSYDASGCGLKVLVVLIMVEAAQI